jgi:hypothetical protein
MDNMIQKQQKQQEEEEADKDRFDLEGINHFHMENRIQQQQKPKHEEEEEGNGRFDLEGINHFHMEKTIRQQQKQKIDHYGGRLSIYGAGSGLLLVGAFIHYAEQKLQTPTIQQRERK